MSTDDSNDGGSSTEQLTFDESLGYDDRDNEPSQLVIETDEIDVDDLPDTVHVSKYSPKEVFHWAGCETDPPIETSLATAVNRMNARPCKKCLAIAGKIDHASSRPSRNDIGDDECRASECDNRVLDIDGFSVCKAHLHKSKVAKSYDDQLS